MNCQTKTMRAFGFLTQLNLTLKRLEVLINLIFRWGLFHYISFPNWLIDVSVRSLFFVHSCWYFVYYWKCSFWKLLVQWSRNPLKCVYWSNVLLDRHAVQLIIFNKRSKKSVAKELLNKKKTYSENKAHQRFSQESFMRKFYFIFEKNFVCKISITSLLL